jgi:hypothetical protein
MRRLDPVVFAFCSRRVPRQAACGTQILEVVLAARQEFVRIGLMAGIEDQRITRRIEYPMKGDGQLDYTEIRAEVPP